MQRDGVIVLGMHRSGTSAVTSALNAMGFHVAAPDKLTATSWENPQGFFERRDLRAIFDARLHGAGADWWRVSDFAVDAIPPAVHADNGERIRALKERLEAYGPWVIKEPRLCLLLPLFEAFTQRAVIVQPVRHPLEVARSLARRNGIPLCAGIAPRPRSAGTVHAWLLITAGSWPNPPRPASASRVISKRRAPARSTPMRARPVSRLTCAASARTPGRERDFVGPPQAALRRAVVDNDTAAIDAASSPTVVGALRAYEAAVVEKAGMEAQLHDLRAQRSAGESAAGADAVAERDAMKAALEGERARVNDLLASRSWRLTAPLHRCGDLARRLHRG